MSYLVNEDGEQIKKAENATTKENVNKVREEEY